MEPEDELTGIFDNMEPWDFLETASAEMVSASAEPNQGAERFNKFVDLNIEVVRTGWLAADGQINPVAVLAGPHAQWTFVPTDDETMGDYMERLRKEASQLGATWLFISRRTMVGTLPGDHDTGDQNAVREALETGRVRLGVFYYAERREGDEVQVRHGMMQAMGNHLGAPIEGPTEQTTSFFAGILG